MCTIQVQTLLMLNYYSTLTTEEKDNQCKKSESEVRQFLLAAGVGP